MKTNNNASDQNRLCRIIRGKYARKAVLYARLMASSARELARLDATMHAELDKVLPSDMSLLPYDEGHSTVQFGWRSELEGFNGIALYGAEVAEVAAHAVATETVTAKVAVLD